MPTSLLGTQHACARSGWLCPIDAKGEPRIAIFFFQAEDGIRDRDVTGVQTCASDLASFQLAEISFSKSKTCRHLASIDPSPGIAVPGLFLCIHPIIHVRE